MRLQRLREVGSERTGAGFDGQSVGDVAEWEIRITKANVKKRVS